VDVTPARFRREALILAGALAVGVAAGAALFIVLVHEVVAR
jgi:hypothetical protein